MENVLIVGANGTTGKIIVDLIRHDEKLRPFAMVREKEQQKQFEDKGVETVLADLEKDVSEAVKGMHKVVFAAGSGGNTSEEKTILVDQEGAKKIIDASKKEGIRKFVMLSAIKADEPDSHPKLSKYLQAKLNADKYLQSSGLNYTIVRPGTLTDDEATGMIKKEEKLDEGGKITRADVAQVLLYVLQDEVAKNDTFEIIGGETPVNKAIS